MNIMVERGGITSYNITVPMLIAEEDIMEEYTSRRHLKSNMCNMEGVTYENTQ